MTVSLGYGLITAQVPPGSGRTYRQEYADTLKLANLAERAGFGSLWVSEHHGVADGYVPSLTVLLSALAAVTRESFLGMGVGLAPFQHPLRFAEDSAVVDQISGGRLLVGLGLGWREEEFRAFGIPVRERVGRTRELVEICRLAWGGERFSFHGTHHKFDQVAVTPPPTRPIPLLMGGTVEASVTRAGRLGDGFLSSQWASDPDTFLSRVATFDRGVISSGRDPARMLLVAFLNVFVTVDGRLPEEVIAGVWHQLAAYSAWRTPTDVPGRVFELPPLDRSTVASSVIAGTPEAVAERLLPWTSALSGREFILVVRLHYPGVEYGVAAESLELFADQVVPLIGIAKGAQEIRRVCEGNSHVSQ